MRNFPEKYKSKLETLKRAIIIRSPLRSELGDGNISIELADWDYDQSKEQFYELHLEVTITNVECEDCYFEGGMKIGEELNVLMEKSFIYYKNSAGIFLISFAYLLCSILFILFTKNFKLF